MSSSLRQPIPKRELVGESLTQSVLKLDAITGAARAAVSVSSWPDRKSKNDAVLLPEKKGENRTGIVGELVVDRMLDSAYARRERHRVCRNRRTKVDLRAWVWQDAEEAEAGSLGVHGRESSCSRACALLRLSLAAARRSSHPTPQPEPLCQPVHIPIRSIPALAVCIANVKPSCVELRQSPLACDWHRSPCNRRYRDPTPPYHPSAS
jgi:hypothetical protein